MKLAGLRQARRRGGLSIGRLAELTGLRRETITALEQGKDVGQAYMAHRLSEVLSASVVELLDPRYAPDEPVPAIPSADSRGMWSSQ